MKRVAFTTDEVKRNIHRVTFHNVKVKDRFKFLLISDVHFDSRKCDRDLLKKHLDEAKEEGALIIIDGDWFDVMQGKYDPRGGKYDIRPEYKHADYLDQVTKDSIRFLTPYKNNIFLITQGNHETNILKRLETNITQTLVDGLNMQKPEHRIYMGGYSGWVRFYFKRGSMCESFLMKYHHGSGGGQRSKGVLSIDIDQMKYPDADIIIKGHDHHKWYHPQSALRLSQSNIEKYSTVHHIRLGSYKMLGDGFAGWETEKDFNQPRLGGWWLTFDVNTKKSYDILVQEAK